jgi:hypothetical protein
MPAAAHTEPYGSLRGALKNSCSFVITPTLPLEQRAALEHLFFFNANQHRVLPGIQQCIANYGLPEIFEHQGNLRIRVGNVEDVRTLYAVSELGHPLGVAVFVHLPHERFVVLHLVVEPRLRSTLDINTPVLLELMREIRSTARRMRGVDRVEVVYNPRYAARLGGEVPEPR